MEDKHSALSKETQPGLYTAAGRRRCSMEFSKGKSTLMINKKEGKKKEAPDFAEKTDL